MKANTMLWIRQSFSQQTAQSTQDMFIWLSVNKQFFEKKKKQISIKCFSDKEKRNQPESDRLND